MVLNICWFRAIILVLCLSNYPIRQKILIFYEFDEKTLSLVSSVGRFRIGEKVEVRVASCNLPDRKINFEFVKKLNSTKSRA